MDNRRYSLTMIHRTSLFDPDWPIQLLAMSCDYCEANPLDWPAQTLKLGISATTPGVVTLSNAQQIWLLSQAQHKLIITNYHIVILFMPISMIVPYEAIIY